LKVNIKLLFEFAVKGYDISSFAKNLADYDVSTMRDELLIKIGIIANKIKKGNPEASSVFEAVENKLGEHFASPEQFI
jgi:hypothetical protein